MVVQMNSRPRDGERMRSNPMAKHRETQDTGPPWNDKVIRGLKLNPG